MSEKRFVPISQRAYVFGDVKRRKNAGALVRGILLGDLDAVRHLQSGFFERSITTSDFAFALANVANAGFVGEYPDTEDWSNNGELFDTVKTTSMSNIARSSFQMHKDPATSGRSEGAPVDTLPRVDELAPFTEFAFQEGGTMLRGGKWGAKLSASFEALQNQDNVLNFSDEVVRALQSFVPRTRQWSYITQLLNSLAAGDHLKAGTVEGNAATIPVNAPFSVDAYRLALKQIKARKVNGRSVQVLGNKFFVFCSPTTADLIRYVQSIQYNEFVSGDPASTTQTRFITSNSNPTTNLTIIESSFIPDDTWILVPFKSAVPNGRNPFTYVTFPGFEVPDLRLQNSAGQAINGGNLGPMMGSFDNDGIAFRIRMFGDFNFVNSEAVIASTGKGV